MYKKTLVILVVFIGLLSAEEKMSTDAITIPKLLNYQGKLTNLAGAPVPDSQYSITFRLHRTAIGATSFWTETQLVQTLNGIFSVSLGSVVPIESIPESGNCYLEMQVGNNPPMSPRIRLTSSAYAYLAKKAESAEYAPLVRPISPPITNPELGANVVTTDKIQDGTIQIADLAFTPVTRPITPGIATTEIQDNAITTGKILNNTILREDVAVTFKAPYADTSDYARNIPVVNYVDSARIATNAHKIQGKDTIALSNKYVDEGQSAGGDLTGTYPNPTITVNAVTSAKILNGTILREDVAPTFKSPYADTSDYVRNVPAISYVDSARVSVNAHNAHRLQGKDTLALSAKFVDESQVNSITNPMIVDNAITTAKIADNNITTAKITDNAITAVKIADNSITTAKITDNAITTGKILNNTILREDVAVTFKAPYADTSDYARNIPVVNYVDSARIATNAHKIQGKDTIALSNKYVDEGQSAGGDLTGTYPNPTITVNAVTSAKILNGTILREDVAPTFKSPYADTSDYVRNVPAISYVDSARISVNAYNAYYLQGKDTVALDGRYVNEGQTNSITNPMIIANAITTDKIQDGTITRSDVSLTFKAPLADTADYVRYIPGAIDSARVSANAHKLQGKDTITLSAKFIDEGQTNAISANMIIDGNVTMAKINQAGATIGQVIKWNGSSWEPANDSVGTGAGGPPSGPAGGDLTGTYPNPTIAYNAVNSQKILDHSIKGIDIALPCTLEATVNRQSSDAILNINNTGSGSGIKVINTGGDGIIVEHTNGAGLAVNNAEQYGITMDTCGYSGIHIRKTNEHGIYLENPSGHGVNIDYAGQSGFYVHQAGTTGLYVFVADDAGLDVWGNNVGGIFWAGDDYAPAIIAHAFEDNPSDTAIYAYGSGIATGGWITATDHGLAYSIVSTDRKLVACGSARVNNGQSIISFDKIFADNVRTDIPIIVNITAKGEPTGILVVKETNAFGFKVQLKPVAGWTGDDNVEFNWIAIGTMKEIKPSTDTKRGWQRAVRMRTARVRNTQPIKE